LEVDDPTKKYIAALGAVVALAVPSVALAESPASWASEASQGAAKAIEAAGAQCGRTRDFGL